MHVTKPEPRKIPAITLNSLDSKAVNLRMTVEQNGHVRVKLTPTWVSLLKGKQPQTSNKSAISLLPQSSIVDFKPQSPMPTSASYGHGYGQTGTQFHSHEYTDAVIMVKLSSEQLDEKLNLYTKEEDTPSIADRIKSLHGQYNTTTSQEHKNKLITKIQNHFNTLKLSSTGK